MYTLTSCAIPTAAYVRCGLLVAALNRSRSEGFAKQQKLVSKEFGKQQSVLFAERVLQALRRCVGRCVRSTDGILLEKLATPETVSSKECVRTINAVKYATRTVMFSFAVDTWYNNTFYDGTSSVVCAGNSI